MITQNKQTIKDHEGLRLTAYKDGGGVWTIGYGHTGSDVREGLTIPLSEAERLLTRDLRVAEGYVNKLVQVKLTQNQFDALVSFVYNVGGDAFAKSTMLRLLNAGEYEGAANQFLRWNKDNGKVVDGLTNRRRKERELFLKGM
ncbi:Lysozyme RrrD [compost metagenome]